MDIFFPDPNDPPLHPEAVRLRDLRAEPSPDGRRVKVYLELTPFLKRPSAEVLLIGPDGSEAASTAILEAFSRKMEFNLHLPLASAGVNTACRSPCIIRSCPPQSSLTRLCPNRWSSTVV